MKNRYLLILLMISACGGHKKAQTSPGLPPPSDSPAVPPSPVPPSYPGSGDIVGQQQYLIFHNLKRCWHNVGKVTWAADLEEKAKARLATCDLALGLDHGESLGTGTSIINALDQWYLSGMISFPYGYDAIPPTMKRFSQMVWKGTTEIGCASAQCGGVTQYLCRYREAEVDGKAAANVLTLKPDFLRCTGT
jgi:pathogenesis-related protein 1